MRTSRGVTVKVRPGPRSVLAPLRSPRRRAERVSTGGRGPGDSGIGGHHDFGNNEAGQRRERSACGRPRYRDGRVRVHPAARHRVLQHDLRHRRDRQLARLRRQRALRDRRPAGLGVGHPHPLRPAAHRGRRHRDGQPASPLVRRRRGRDQRHRDDVLHPGIPALGADHHRRGRGRAVGAVRLRQPREPGSRLASQGPDRSRLERALPSGGIGMPSPGPVSSDGTCSIRHRARAGFSQPYWVSSSPVTRTPTARPAPCPDSGMPRRTCSSPCLVSASKIL